LWKKFVSSDQTLSFVYWNENGPGQALVNAAGIPFTAISSGKLRRYWSWNNVSDLKNIWRGYRGAVYCARVATTCCRYRQLVVSVPVHYAAYRQGYTDDCASTDVQPVFNRLMARWADTVTVAFAVCRPAFRIDARCISNRFDLRYFLDN
jgi:UDP-N-acetylglucosamine--N-acetylmuramyl-(pentapeptide) pyrophosphoryl-undecaprenol N-acetylglucosamine transferase